MLLSVQSRDGVDEAQGKPSANILPWNDRKVRATSLHLPEPPPFPIPPPALGTGTAPLPEPSLSQASSKCSRRSLLLQEGRLHKQADVCKQMSQGRLKSQGTFFFHSSHFKCCQDALIAHWRQNIQKGAAETIRGGNFQVVPSFMVRDGLCLVGAAVL